MVAHYTSDKANYTNADSSAVSFTIAKADASVLVNGYSGVYDGQAHGASLGHATGIGGVDLSSGVTLGASFTNVPGGTAQWTFSYANYNDQSGDAAIDISKASAVISVTPYSVIYNGVPHTATGTATGVNGGSLSGLDLSGTTHTGTGTAPYTDSWTFSNPNYNSASGTVVDTINAAPAPQRYRLVKEAVLVPVTKLVANRQRIASSEGLSIRHRITPLNVGRSRHLRRRLVAVPACIAGRERRGRVAPEAGGRAAQRVFSRQFVRFPA